MHKRMELWGRATALPKPEPADFVTVPPENGPAREQLRLISDAQLRTKLLGVGMAQVVQAPRGRQKIPTIIRLRSNLDGRGQPTSEKPTIEELRELIERIAAEEAALVAASVAELERRVTSLRSRFAEVEGAHLEELMGQVALLLAARDDLRRRSRAEALAAVAADPNFPLRRFLPLIRDSLQPADAVRSPRPVEPEPVPQPKTARIDERLAYRETWRQRLLPLLTPTWQGSGTIAFQARAKPKQVLEQLRYMALDGLIERRTARVADQVSRSRRVQKHKRRLEAQFRLAVDLPRVV